MLLKAINLPCRCNILSLVWLRVWLIECVTLAMLWFPLLPFLSGILAYIFSFEDTWKSELRTCGQVGFTLSQATKALRESRIIALPYFRPLHLKEERGQRNPPAAPNPRERHGTHFTGGWVGLRAGLDWCGKSRRTGIRSPDTCVQIGWFNALFVFGVLCVAFIFDVLV